MWPLDPAPNFPILLESAPAAGAATPEGSASKKIHSLLDLGFFSLHFLGGVAIPAAGPGAPGMKRFQAGIAGREQGVAASQTIIPHGNVVIP